MKHPLIQAYESDFFDEEEKYFVQDCLGAYIRSFKIRSDTDKWRDFIAELNSTEKQWALHALMTDDELKVNALFEEGKKDIELDVALYELLDFTYEQVLFLRLKPLTDAILLKTSLAPDEEDAIFEKHIDKASGKELYRNTVEKLNVDFFVERLDFPLEVLDPRIVRVSANKNNELHKHAHETVFVFFKGSGQVLIDDVTVPVQPGSIVYIPRWAMHQSQNLSNEEMVFLAVADFGFTEKAFIGNYLKTARMK